MRKCGMVVAILAVLASAAAPVYAGPASQGYVPGGSDESIDFDEILRCEGGSVAGKVCTVDGDCTGGGTCVTAWRMHMVPDIGTDHVRRTEQREMTGSAIAVFSTAATPCTSVRIKALSTNTATVWVGYSGVTSSSGWELLPGEAIEMAPTAGADCNSIFAIGTASDKIVSATP